MRDRQEEPLIARVPRGSGPFGIAYHVGLRSSTRWLTGADRFLTLEAAETEAVTAVRRERRADLTPIVRKGVLA